MPFKLPTLLSFQGSAHLLGVGSFNILYETYVLEVDKDKSSYDVFVDAGGIVIEPTEEQLESFQNEYASKVWDLSA